MKGVFKMYLTYPAIFYNIEEDNGINYIISFPDIDSNVTQGKDINDSMFMAQDYLGVTLSYYLEELGELPKSTDINKIDLEKNNPFIDDADFVYSKEKSFVSMVSVDLTEYLNS